VLGAETNRATGSTATLVGQSCRSAGDGGAATPPYQLWQTPFPTADVQQQAGIAKDLELLADFVADVPIIGMELLKLPLEDIGVRRRELLSRRRRKEASSFPACGPRLVTSSPTIHQPSHNIQHVQRPAPKAFGVLISRMGLSRV